MDHPPHAVIDRYFRALAAEESRLGVHYSMWREPAWRRWRDEERIDSTTEQMILIWLLNRILSAAAQERADAAADWHAFRGWILHR